jgi:hypothetical protein
MRMSIGTLGSLSLALSVVMAAPALSQERVGVVTTVIGPVTVARASAPAEPLKFKDDIFLRDRITTGDAAMTRILMGGKVVVTARERSTLTITEVPGLSTIDLTSGRIAVAVDKTRMKPGERVDVRTPNAIAGVRGTVLIVETVRNTSSVTVLRGLVEVVRLDPATGRGIGPVTPVGAHQTVTVRSNTLPARPQTITRDRAQQLSQEFTPPIRTVGATSVMPVENEVARAHAVLKELLPTTGGLAAATSGPRTSTAAIPTTSTLTSSPLAKPTTISTTPAAPSTTLLPPTSTTMPKPTASFTTPSTSLLQPVVQPVVQPIVQPVVQPVLQPVTNLLK